MDSVVISLSSFDEIVDSIVIPAAAHFVGTVALRYRILVPSWEDFTIEIQERMRAALYENPHLMSEELERIAEELERIATEELDGWLEDIIAVRTVWLEG